MTNYTKLEQKIREKCEGSCRVCDSEKHNPFICEPVNLCTYCSHIEKGECTRNRVELVLLNHVLKAIDSVTTNRNEFELSIKSSGLLMNADQCLEVKWDTDKPALKDQPQELHELLYKILLDNT